MLISLYFFALYDQSYINDLLENDNMHEDAHLPCRQSFNSKLYVKTVHSP
jgi:hypothetical protein